MDRRIGVLLLLVLVCGCAPAGGRATPSASPSAEPVVADFSRYVGAYHAADGGLWLTNASGHLLSVRDSTFRQLYATASQGRFSIGPAFQVPTPKQADVSFDQAGVMSIRSVNGRIVRARPISFRATEVRIPAAGATLAGTITQPLSPGPHPGIVIVHGSESGERFYYGIWVGLYASLGMAVLSYDKRGHGSSTGVYPGEVANAAALAALASDAADALRFLAAWPGVDARRVGFHGGSQGGWTVPLAIARFHAPAAFAVLLSAPAVTVDQQSAWADFSGSSTVLPTVPEADMEAQVRAVKTSGYDPKPALAAVTQPVLWLNGSADRQVPTAINTEILRGFSRPQWEIDVLPGVDHGLFENPSGLVTDEAKATQLARGLGATMAGWLGDNAGSAALP